MLFVSKPELAKAVVSVFAANRITSLNVKPTDIFVHDQGSVAYHFGNYEEVIEAIDGKTPATTIRNNYASRWRRGPDNVWRVDRFLATPQPKQASAQ
jgi:ketosteroid isomerase-like protein